MQQIAEELAISKSQTYVPIRNRKLRSLKIGGRGQYRVERTEREAVMSGPTR